MFGGGFVAFVRNSVLLMVESDEELRRWIRRASDAVAPIEIDEVTRPADLDDRVAATVAVDSLIGSGEPPSGDGSAITRSRLVLVATMAAAIAAVVAVLLLGGGELEPDRDARDDSAEEGLVRDDALVGDELESALGVGWSWRSTDWPSDQRVGVLGQLSDGRHVAMQIPHYEFECLSCAFLVYDGVSWEAYRPEPLIGRRVAGVSVSGGLLWAIVNSDRSREMFVSSDGEIWSSVELDLSGIEGEVGFERLIEVADVGHRFLAIGDNVLSVGAPGFLGWSNDRGRTFGFIEPPWAPALSEEQAWIAGDRFFVLSGGELWSSGDGREWTPVGSVTGFPEGAESVGHFSTEPHVVWLGDQNLMTMSWPLEGSQAIYRSTDAGLTWIEDPGPYPWAGADVTVATVIGGWFQVYDPTAGIIWVSSDGQDWYLLDSPGVVLTPEVGGSGVAVRPTPQEQDDTDSLQASSGRTEWQFAVPPD